MEYEVTFDLWVKPNGVAERVTEKVSAYSGDEAAQKAQEIAERRSEGGVHKVIAVLPVTQPFAVDEADEVAKAEHEVATADAALQRSEQSLRAAQAEHDRLAQEAEKARADREKAGQLRVAEAADEGQRARDAAEANKFEPSPAAKAAKDREKEAAKGDTGSAAHDVRQAQKTQDQRDANQRAAAAKVEADRAAMAPKAR